MPGNRPGAATGPPLNTSMSRRDAAHFRPATPAAGQLRKYGFSETPGPEMMPIMSGSTLGLVVLEVWPESHWPGFALRQTDVL